MNIFKSTAYSAVRQTEVYASTTEPVPESLSPTQAVFEKYFQGRFNNKPKWVFTTMICGLCAITIGSIFVAVDPYETILKYKCTFAPGKEEYEMWEKPKIELYLKVYLFNVTNKEEYMSGKDDKLKFNEVGPYVYREYLTHGNATFNENGTITSIPLHPLEYVPHMSRSQDEKLVLPNIALLSIGHVLRDAMWVTRVGINMIVRNTRTEALVEMTAKEFMFGYESTLMTLGAKFLPSWISFDKLGLIDRMYHFEGDTSTVFSGLNNFRHSGLIDNYNGRPYLPQWPAPCHNLSLASDGTKFPSKIGKDDELRFFRKSLCRSMPMVRVGEETVRGIHAYKYLFKENAMDNGEYLSENKCFCKESCLPRGILDVRDCYYGFPIALSYPHFLDTDQRVLDAVEGMRPDREQHQSYFVINEEGGIPLNVSVKMQINMALGNLKKIANCQKFSNLVLPMLWMEIQMPGLPDDMNTKFFFLLTIGSIFQTLMIYLLLVCGVAFILLSLISALLIPKISLISNGRNPQTGESAEWKNVELPIGKKRVPPPSQSAEGNKEMDMYYCSLLAAPNEES